MGFLTEDGDQLFFVFKLEKRRNYALNLNIGHLCGFLGGKKNVIMRVVKHPSRLN